MDENDANRANYEEIEGHVNILSAKIAQLAGGNKGITATLEDLEDQYERAIQLRVMRNNTLQELLRETVEEHEAFRRRLWIAAAAAGSAAVAALILIYPAAAVSMVRAYWSQIGTAIVTLAIAMPIRRRAPRRRPDEST